MNSLDLIFLAAALGAALVAGWNLAILRRDSTPRAEPRRGLVRTFEWTSEDEVLHSARGWLLDGCAVRIIPTARDTWTLEAWDV